MKTPEVNIPPFPDPPPGHRWKIVYQARWHNDGHWNRDYKLKLKHRWRTVASDTFTVYGWSDDRENALRCGAMQAAAAILRRPAVHAKTEQLDHIERRAYKAINQEFRT